MSKYDDGINAVLLAVEDYVLNEIENHAGTKHAYEYGRYQVALDLSEILTRMLTSPAEALRKHDAALIEGLADEVWGSHLPLEAWGVAPRPGPPTTRGAVMTDDYTPSPDKVRKAWIEYQTEVPEDSAYIPMSADEALESFDRMIEAVRAGTLREVADILDGYAGTCLNAESAAAIERGRIEREAGLK